MSTVRRLFDHPKNTQVIDGRAVQRCCDGNAPYWDTYRIRDTEDAWASRDSERNMPAYKQSDPLHVEDATGASDGNVNLPEYDSNGRLTGSNDRYKGMVLVEGPNSGYRPDFLTAEQWMAWQGVYWGSDPRGVKLANGQYAGPSLPNPPRWRRTQIRDDKMRWGKGPGGWAAYGHTFLWCQKCETALESAWSDTLDFMPMVGRGVAMVVSNIPVIGTAISFVIGAAIAIAQDEPLDDAMLSAIGGALPGQPTSGMAFNAGVAIAKGKRVDEVAIAALPIPTEMKKLVSVASNVVYGLASGQHVTKVIYDEIRKKLPPDAQKAMDLAKRVAQGEDIPGIIMDEAERAVLNGVREKARTLVDAAKAKGEAALGEAKAQADALVNNYAAQSGYQVALMALPTWERDAIQTGLAAGAMTKGPFVGTFGTVLEKSTAKGTNDTYYAKGLAIVNAGARYKGVPLRELLAGKPFSVQVMQPDAFTGAWAPRLQHYSTVQKSRASDEFLVDDSFRRGFLIATGLCEGMTERGPGQTAVYQSLAEKGGRAGFDAGQAVAHFRAKNGDSNVVLADVMQTEVKANAALSAMASAFASQPKSVATIRAGLPTLAPPRSMPLVMASDAYAQKTADRARWVDYYKKLG